MWSISKETDPAVDSNRERGSEGEESDDNEEQCRTGDTLDIEGKPNQLHPELICVQTLPNKVLHFQKDWYRQHPWRHYSPTVNGILCFHCVKTYTIMKSKLSKKADGWIFTMDFLIVNMLLVDLKNTNIARLITMQSQSIAKRQPQ
jgi:hypothetical protein